MWIRYRFWMCKRMFLTSDRKESSEPIREAILLQAWITVV